MPDLISQISRVYERVEFVRIFPNRFEFGDQPRNFILAAVPGACGGKRLQPRGEAWRLSQRPLVDESPP